MDVKRAWQQEMTAQHRQPQGHGERSPQRAEQEERAEAGAEDSRAGEAADMIAAGVTGHAPAAVSGVCLP